MKKAHHAFPAFIVFLILFICMPGMRTEHFIPLNELNEPSNLDSRRGQGGDILAPSADDSLYDQTTVKSGGRLEGAGDQGAGCPSWHNL